MDQQFQVWQGPEGRVVRYNEREVAEAHRGWISGSFITLPDGEALTSSFEVKKGFLKAGTSRDDWSVDPAGECLEIILSGKMRKFFKINGKEETIDTGPGTIITWQNAVPHRWLALENSEYVVIRTLG